MVVSRDLVVATAVLVVCTGLLWGAFVAPGRQAPTDRTTPEVAKNDPAERALPSRFHPGSSDTDESPSRLPTTPPKPRETRMSPEDLGIRPEPPALPAGPVKMSEPPPPVAEPLKPDALPSFTLGQPRPSETETRASTTNEAIRPSEATKPTGDPVLPAGPRTHIVAKDDRLWDLSIKYYSNTKHIKDIDTANKLNGRRLRIGETLIIPTIDAPAAAPASKDKDATAATTVTAGRTYTVQEGDSFYLIAQEQLKDGRRYLELMKLNSKGEQDLHPGEVIKLPDAKTVASSAKPDLPVSPAANTGRIHVVGEDQTLADISDKYYKTTRHWRLLAQVNNLSDPNSLSIGQKLVIPELPTAGAAKPSEAKPTETTTPAQPRYNTYISKTGDKLSSISQKHYGNTTHVADLQKANPSLNPDRIPAGTRIRIPILDTPAPAPTSKPTEFHLDPAVPQ